MASCWSGRTACRTGRCFVDVSFGFLGIPIAVVDLPACVTLPRRNWLVADLPHQLDRSEVARSTSPVAAQETARRDDARLDCGRSSSVRQSTRASSKRRCCSCNSASSQAGQADRYR